MFSLCLVVFEHCKEGVYFWAGGVHLGIGMPNILHRTSVYFLEEEQKFGSHLSNVHLFKKQTYLFRNKIYTNPDIT